MNLKESALQHRHKAVALTQAWKALEGFSPSHSWSSICSKGKIVGTSKEGLLHRMQREVGTWQSLEMSWVILPRIATRLSRNKSQQKTSASSWGWSAMEAVHSKVVGMGDTWKDRGKAMEKSGELTCMWGNNGRGTKDMRVLPGKQTRIC